MRAEPQDFELVDDSVTVLRRVAAVYLCTNQCEGIGRKFGLWSVQSGVWGVGWIEDFGKTPVYTKGRLQEPGSKVSPFGLLFRVLGFESWV